MKSVTRKIKGAGAATVLALTGLALVGSPANAAEPTGGCWVYSVPAGSAIEAQPGSNISSSLAPWADSAGPDADYNTTTSGGTAVGATRNFSMTFNTGPKNGGPPASGTVYYYFSVNGANLPPISKPFNAPGGGSIPGDTINGSFAINSVGAHAVTFRKVIYDIPAFTTRVQCNGQTNGTAGGSNPATQPSDTNIVSAPFNAAEGTMAVTKAGSVKGKLIVGKSLKAKSPTTAPGSTATYQWKRGSKNIKKATGKKYKLVAKDKGKKISVVMTMTASGYTTMVQTVKAGKVKAAN